MDTKHIKFDINGPAPSTETIEQARDALQAQLQDAEHQRSKLNRKIRLLSAVLFVAAIAIMIQLPSGALFPWDTPAALCITLGLILGYNLAEHLENALTLTIFSVAFGAAAFAMAGVIMPLSADSATTDIVAGMFLSIGVANVALAIVMLPHIDNKEFIANEMQHLEDAPKEACLELQEALEYPAVAAYRDQVTAHGRVFVQAELDAINAWTAKAKIDDACRNVYFGTAAHA